MKTKTIGVCGLGYTGSGAVIDYLHEFSENQINDGFEFNLAYIPDGLQDLEFHLMREVSRYYSSDFAIMRFLDFVAHEANNPKSFYMESTGGRFEELSKEFIASITQVSWDGMWMMAPHPYGKLENWIRWKVLRRLKGNNINYRQMYVSVQPENFYEAAHIYVDQLLKLMGCDYSKNVVLNQPFAGNAPQHAFVFFRNPVAIVVDRDPRDLYLLIKEVTHSPWVPIDDVKKFVIYYRSLRRGMGNSVPGVLRLRFEDMIYEYEKTTKQIDDYIGLTNHDHPMEYFKPAVSRNNTQLYRKYKNHTNEIKYIEEQLADYLYPFKNYPAIDAFGETF